MESFEVLIHHIKNKCARTAHKSQIRSGEFHFAKDSFAFEMLVYFQLMYVPVRVALLWGSYKVSCCLRIYLFNFAYFGKDNLDLNYLNQCYFPVLIEVC